MKKIEMIRGISLHHSSGQLSSSMISLNDELKTIVSDIKVAILKRLLQFAKENETEVVEITSRIKTHN